MESAPPGPGEDDRVRGSHKGDDRFYGADRVDHARRTAPSGSIEDKQAIVAESLEPGIRPATSAGLPGASGFWSSVMAFPGSNGVVGELVTAHTYGRRFTPSLYRAFHGKLFMSSCIGVPGGAGDAGFGGGDVVFLDGICPAPSD